MKKIFKEATFKDFKGNERSFTVCGVLIDDSDGVTTLVVGHDEEGVLNHRTDDYEFAEVPENMLRIGLSFCHEHDTNKPELGKVLAEGRALKEDSSNCVFTSTNSLVLNMRLVHQILDFVVADVQYAPGKYIKGYNDMEIKYNSKLKQSQLNSEPTPESSNNE